MAKHGLVIDVSSVPPKPAGAGRYAIELVSNLGRLTGGFDLIAKSGDTGFWEDLSSARVALKAPDRRPLRIVWEEGMLSRQLRVRGSDIFHGTHYTIPHGYRGPRISTIHDLTMIEHPEWHERIKVAYFSRAIRYAVEEADAIIVPSEFTRSRLEMHFGQLENVNVIHHGVDHQRFKPLGAIAAAEGGHDSDHTFGSEKLVLHIGTIEPRKNLENLVTAFDILAAQDSAVRLLLVGQRGWKSEEVYSRIGSSKYHERIQQIGYLSEEEMLKVLLRSSCVVYPSFAEGFGLPVLEAMAAGVPVVTSAGSVMEEVAGECAWLCDPLDPEDISRRMVQAMSGSEDAILKVSQGIARSQEYSWSDSAKKHLDVYAALGFGSES